MVAPLIIGAARIIGKRGVQSSTQSAGGAGLSRIARAQELTERKGVAARFAESQSLAARATQKRTDESSISTPQKQKNSRLFARFLKKQDAAQGKTPQDTSSIKKVFGMAVNIRYFIPLLLPTIIVSALIAFFGLLAAFSLFASELLSWLTVGFVDVSNLGLIFIGLAIALVVVAYPVTLIYLMFVKGLHPSFLTGIPFIAFFLLPVFDMIPGVNLFPWLVLWVFFLCMAPQKK